MDYHNQKKKITFKVIPHTSSEIFSVRISKRIIKITAIFLLISLLTLIGGLYYYYNQYTILAPYEDKTEQLKEKNAHLKDKLARLSSETKQIKQQFERIKQENKKIKQMVDFKAEIKEKLSSNKTRTETNIRQVSQTISNSDSYSYNSEQLIQQTETNLNLLKEKLPKKKKDLSKLEKDVNQYKDYMASRPEGWPVEKGEGRIVSTFGYRVHPILKERKFHEGLDIGIWYRHKVVSTGAGKVVFAGRKSGYGNVVIVDHGFNYRTLYAHNNRLLVSVGERVARGEAIALSGNTGRSTGPHVHYEVQYNRKPVDPMKYID